MPVGLLLEEHLQISISNVRGVSIPNGHPVFGTDIYDVATLEIKLKVPRDAKTLSFKWIFGSDEIPEYVDEYRDFFRAYVKLPDGSTKDIALLPNGNIPYIGDGIRNYTSTPSPDDVAMNEVTPVYTGTLDVSAYRGKEITIVFQIADEKDNAVDTVAFIDDLKFERISTREIYLTLLTLTQLWTKYFFNYYDEFDELYANASALGVDNETLQKALELHNSAVEYMKHGWRMDDLEEIRARIWVNIHALPRVSDVRRAYLNEKAAVELLKAAISEIT
ncbi:choice-of-anchor L domain-containing protein [Palaeococcus sp. (in: euryarchaeotes)]|uniref:choice-of-anchor L domain-containing protein n=1 Tax=Palaeococcus sp. (in: euryarchaeotes) TaxID=2820298 RepID=UPI0025EA58BA|nr:choice-of-anchor L domain-containing protein [Palaeococcus sp. (in: euryarchaeotes)]